jgi:TonB family protein
MVWPRSILILALLAQATPAFSQEAKPAAARKVEPPQLVRFIEAPYPEAEKETGGARTVVLQIAISTDGKVTEAAVVESGGAAFDEAALGAVRQFEFVPAKVNDQPIAVKVTYRYSFAAPEPPPPIVGEFRGVVRDKAKAAPVAAAQVTLEGVGTVTTDAEGRFEFKDVPPGPHQVLVEAPGLTALSVTEEVVAGQALEASYDIVTPPPETEAEPTDDYEIAIIAPPELERQAVQVGVRAEEARSVPGTQGDVLKVVESMPGVARAAAGTGNVVVWGAAPGDTRTYVGGVRIPVLYHFGGFRSVVHGDEVAGVDLTAGGYGAAYGRGLGGLITVERKAHADEFHGSVQADIIDASAAVRLPVGKKGLVSVTGRKSYVAELGSLLSDQSFQNYFTLPSFGDGSARYRHQLSENETLEFGGLFSSDAKTRTSPSDNPEFRSSETRSLNFMRFDVTYRKQSNDGSRLLVVPWYGMDWTARSSDFGGIQESQSSSAHVFGLRVDYQKRAAEHIVARVGLDIEGLSAGVERRGSLTTPPREGDPYIFGRPPANTVAFDNWSSFSISAAPYLELDFALLKDKLHIVPGARIEPYVTTVNRIRPPREGIPDIGTFTQDIGAEPRLLVRYAPGPKVSFHAAGGYYRQSPNPEDLSAVFGNPTLNVGRAAHAVLGTKLNLWPSFAFELTGFLTRSWEIGSRNPSFNPKVSEVLVQEGEGRSTGAQVLLRKEKGDSRYFGWVAYTFLVSERRDAGQTDYRLFDYDQTHVLTALGALDLGAGFEAALRVRLATGYPRTPVTGAFYDAGEGRYEPLLGSRNTTRIPMFFQLDARIAKEFKFDSSKLLLYLDVQNATNQSNPEEIAYSPDYGEQRYVMGLPILPVLGARFEY